MLLSSSRSRVLTSFLVASAAVSAACSNDVGEFFGGAGGTAAQTGPSTTATGATADTGATTGGPATTGATTGMSSSSTGILPSCGDGVVQPPEPCDGQDLGGNDCTAAGYSKPAGARCADNCQLVFDDCEATCGDGNPEPGEECDDGGTAPGDGCSATCTTEVDPCSAPTPVALALGSMTLVGTVGGPSFHEASCSGMGGPEQAYAVTAGADGYLTAWLTNAGTDFDATLSARNACADPGSETVCNDNDGGNNRGGDLVSFPVTNGQTVYLFVEGYNAAQSGGYTLSLDLSVGDDCNDPVPITVELSGKIAVRGFTNEKNNDTNASGCGFAGAGPDVVYQMHFAGGGGDNQVDVSADYNSVVHARTSCDDGDSEVDCDNGIGNDSSISFSEDDVFVWVDGTTLSQGKFSLGFP